MTISSAVAALVGCTFVLGCDVQPSVLFVANGTLYQMLQLTDAQDGCPAASRVCYLTLWDGSASSGCWVREHSNIRVRFADLGEKLIPVNEFQRTMVGEYRNSSLD